MTYKEARVYLDNVSKYGSVLGLITIKRLLGELGNPEKDMKFVHVAGTNGKGSIIAYASSILKEAGYKTGRYISPTVTSYLERMAVNGENIAEDEFAYLVEKVQRAVARMETKGWAHPTVFEIETAAAFLYFKENKCDIVFLETGLGGSEDATNVLDNKLAAVFASISMDHMGFLGNSIKEIAGKKAGIITKGTSVVTSVQKDDAMDVLVNKSLEMCADIHIADQTKAEVICEDCFGQKINYGELKEVFIPLAGRHQIQNAVTVIELMKVLNKKGYNISDDNIKEGISNTKWPGRFTCVNSSPLFIVDGAHNEDAVIRLKDNVLRYFKDKRLIFIMGVFKDKEYDKISSIMGPVADTIYTINLPNEERTLSSNLLKDELIKYCDNVVDAKSYKKAVDGAFDIADNNDVILAFGSLSCLGNIMNYVREKGEKIK